MAEFDVIVVGGGLIGCATAYYLAKQGVSVLVIEAGEINGGASGQNAGSLHFQIERRFLSMDGAARDRAARVVELNQQAVNDWRGLEAELGLDLEIAMQGGLMVAETAADVALLEWKADQEAQWGLSTTLLDAAAVQQRAPYLSSNVVAAVWAPDEGHANPRILTPAYQQAAARLGASFLTGVRVAAIDDHGGRFAIGVVGDDGRRDVQVGRKVVAAAGAWLGRIGELANLHLPLFPLGLTMNVTERRPAFLPHLVQHAGRQLSMKQAHSGNILVGGGWPARLRQAPNGGGFDLSRRPQVLESSVIGNLEAAVRTVPAVAGFNLIRTWTGIVAVSADQLSVVGEVPSRPGFFVAGGGSAFTLGPTFARLLADAVISGRPSELLDIHSPARFEHLNSAMA